MKPPRKPPEPKPEKWVPVEGKRHLEREVHSGRMRYSPPAPQSLYPWPFPGPP